MSHVQQLFNGGESAGTFQLNFNNNRAYELFGREYLKCYANLSAKGKMSKPLPTGPLSYTVDFAMDCGCSSVLFDFNLAYKKTFGNQLQAPPVARVGLRGRAGALPAGARGTGQPPEQP
ncbi:hypothetical protein [Aeromonas caviae]|nr:hypothetical protein [Aeromonas caviae]